MPEPDRRKSADCTGHGRAARQEGSGRQRTERAGSQGERRRGHKGPGQSRDTKSRERNDGHHRQRSGSGRTKDAREQDRDRAPERSGQRTEPRDAPELDESIQFSDLNADARRELHSLPKDAAERVGRHLVAAETLLDEDPQTAWAHARYAKKKAPRLPVVREAAGLTAYRVGQWSEAASDLRAVRRMTRSDLHVAVLADLERALGRPERALDIAKETDTGKLPRAVAIELRIVAAGARRDLGQVDAAVVTLQSDDLYPEHYQPWSWRLFYAYADNLAAAGRTEEAIRWFLQAADADHHEEADAAQRAMELAGE